MVKSGRISEWNWISGKSLISMFSVLTLFAINKSTSLFNENKNLLLEVPNGPGHLVQRMAN